MSGRPEIWLALRSRANASCSEEPFLLHQQALGALDRLARGKRLRQRLRLLTQGHELFVAGARRPNRRQQILLAKGLDEVAEHTRFGGALDELVLPVGGQHHDRNRPLVEDPAGRLDPVELRHLDVEEGQIRPLRAREGHRLLPVARLRAHLETGVLQQGPQVEPDDRLVLGDQNPHLCWVSLAQTAQPRDSAGLAVARAILCGAAPHV